MDLSKINSKNLNEFAEYIQEQSSKIGFKVSARGWGYLLETERVINKDDFDKVAKLINRCRKEGLLPIDFVAEESSREFKGVERPNTNTIVEDLGEWLMAAKDAAESYIPDWWRDETYYIQMVVEKVDLVTLFSPVCKTYHIPIANAKGWSSMLQRAEYAKRFRRAELDGLKCVLLYCGDFDPDGLRISDMLRKNISDLQDILWSDGSVGYDPENLIIDRFGLNFDFIENHDLTWIDNLVTGNENILARVVDGKIVPGIITKGKNAGKPHKNYFMPYMQKYLANYGCRKCEANAIVTIPRIAKEMVRSAILKYLGDDAEERFEIKHQEIRDELNDFYEQTGIDESIDAAIKIINEKS